jgi:phage gp46-like protein
MTDLALHLIDTGAGQPPRIDVRLDGGDLSTDDGLETAVLLSLITDSRAEADDVLPDGGTDRRGWWADAWPESEGDRIGSRLWLLGREKDTATTLQRAREYAEEALAWLLEDGVARRVQVTAERVRSGVLRLSVEIQRPSGDLYQTAWDHQLKAA